MRYVFVHILKYIIFICSVLIINQNKMKYLTELNSNEIKAVAYGMAIAHSLQTSELFDYTIFDVQINESQFSYEFIIKYGALERDFTLLKQETIIKLSRSI